MNRITAVEKSLYLETCCVLIKQYSKEIENFQNVSCEEVLTRLYDLLESLILGSYKLSKKVFDFQDNKLIKLTKLLLFGT
jgi:hypothetical protein